MTELQKEFEATGYTSWINLDLYPNGKIYTNEYVEWLEKRIEALNRKIDKSKEYPCHKCTGRGCPVCDFTGIFIWSPKI